MYGKTAENCNQYLNAGQKVHVVGRLKPDPKTGGPRLYTRHDGTIGASFEIIADTVHFLSDPNGSIVNEETGEVMEVRETEEIPF